MNSHVVKANIVMKFIQPELGLKLAPESIAQRVPPMV